MPGELPGEISPNDGVESVSGVGPAYSEDLENSGYSTVRDLQEADTSELSGVVPSNIARSIKEQVGDFAGPVTTAAKAKKEAQKRPGAKAKVVRVNGSSQARVLEKVSDEHVGGATMEIHKG